MRWVLPLLICPAAAFLAPSPAAVRVAKPQRRTRLMMAGSATLVDGNRVVLTDKATGHEATVWLHGGCVASYKAPHEVLAVRKDAVFDGSKPIAGGLQICWPQFGPGQIQQHGFARNLGWALGSASSSSAEATLVLKDNDATRKIWDEAFELLLDVKLAADHLNVRLTAKNTGSSAWDFTSALHSYYGVSNVQNALIKGSLSGASYVDKTKSPPETVTLGGNIAVDKFLEGVLPNFKGPLGLSDSATGRETSVTHGGGWPDYVLWNPYGNEAMGFETFVCVESGAVSSPISLAPGASWTGELKIASKAA